MAKVSICIPAYNQPDWLRRALESIRIQSYRDYEVIVTDDSTNSLVQDAAREYLSDPRFQYRKNAQRRGTPGNWNEGIRHANGSLIKILHHDDWFTKQDSLAEYVRLLDENPEADFAFSASVAFDSAQHPQFVHQPSAAQLAELSRYPACLFWGNFVGAPSATIFRRQEAMYFDEQLKWLVDVEFYIRMLNRNPRFAFSEKPIVGITAFSAHQVTAEVAKDIGLQLRENFYVYEKLRLPFLRRLKTVKLFRSLFTSTGVTSVKALQGYFAKSPLPFEMRIAIYHETTRRLLSRVFHFLKRTLSKMSPRP